MTRKTFFRPHLEALEDRWLPSFLPVNLAPDGDVTGSAVGDFSGDGRDDIAITGDVPSGGVH